MRIRRTNAGSTMLGLLAASLAIAVAAATPPNVPAPPAPPLPRIPSPPAVAPVQPVLPASAASAIQMPPVRTPQPLPQSPAVKAAEQSVVPGDLRPEQQVVPQIKVPLKGRNSTDSVKVDPAPGGVVGGAVNDDRARCLASSDMKVRASCPNAGPASGPAR